MFVHISDITLTLPGPLSFDVSTRSMSLHSNLRKGLEDGEKALESVVTSPAPGIVEPDDLSIHEWDSLDLEDSRMDTGELGPLSPATLVKVKSWNSLTKYTLTLPVSCTAATSCLACPWHCLQSLDSSVKQLDWLQIYLVGGRRPSQKSSVCN